MHSGMQQEWDAFYRALYRGAGQSFAESPQSGILGEAVAQMRDACAINFDAADGALIRDYIEAVGRMDNARAAFLYRRGLHDGAALALRLLQQD